MTTIAFLGEEQWAVGKGFAAEGEGFHVVLDAGTEGTHDCEVGVSVRYDELLTPLLR